LDLGINPNTLHIWISKYSRPKGNDQAVAVFVNSLFWASKFKEAAKNHANAYTCGGFSRAALLPHVEMVNINQTPLQPTLLIKRLLKCQWRLVA